MTSAPSWVPPSVAAMADASNLGGEVRQRLLTDERMKNVWQYIGSRSVRPVVEYVSRLSGYVRLRDWGIDEHVYTPKEVACSALFAFATVKISSNIEIWSRSTHNESLKQFEDAAQLCRAMINTDNLNFRDAELAACLSKSAAYLEHFANETIRPIEVSAVFVGKDNDNSKARVRALIIAQEMKNLFGTQLCGLVATIVTVGLGLEKSVDRKDVEKWVSLRAAATGSAVNGVPLQE